MRGLHQLTAITDPGTIDSLRSLFASKTLFVADGHHRYEAALAYRDEQRARHPGVDGPREHVLVLLAAVEDPGVAVRPTHRLVRTMGNGIAHQIDATVVRWFELSPSGNSDGRAPEGALFRLLLSNNEEPRDVRARAGTPHRFLLPAEKGQDWQSLDVSAVEGVIDAIRGGSSGAADLEIVPVVEDQVAMHAVASGAASAAFMLSQPTIGRLLDVAEHGDLLPAKSTWFEPKAPAGLVINDLELSAPD